MDFIKVSLNKGQGPYKPGEKLHGKVYVEKVPILSQTKTILVTLFGKAETNWDQLINHKPSINHLPAPSASSDETRIEPDADRVNGLGNEFSMNGVQELVYQIICIFNKKGPCQSCNLQYAPDNFYCFTFLLPKSLPSSFDEVGGRIVYTISVSMELENSDNITPQFLFSIPFQIQQKIDSRINNEVITLLTPTILKDSKTYNGCCKSGKLGYVLTMEQRIFMPGETVPFKLYVCNYSNQDIRLLRAFVLQEFLYKYNESPEILLYSMGLCGKPGPSVPKGQTITWMDSMNLPTNPHYIRNASINCNIICVEHYIVVELVGKTWYKYEKIFLTGKIQLFISDVPLYRRQTDLLRNYLEVESSISIKNLREPKIIQPPPAYHTLIKELVDTKDELPPTYDEITNLNNNIKTTHNNRRFSKENE